MGHYERLSALDASFLDIETRSSSMSVGAVMTFGPGPLVGPQGEIDYERLRSHVIAAIDASPRYRQRIVRVPVIGQPVWVDADDFVLDFHLRHTRLPWPGDPAQLDDLVGVLFSQRLDRDHPLWLAWIVEGLAGGGFALVMKVHHCMVDGVGGADLIARMLQLSPNATDSVATLSPARPRPTRRELVRGEIRHHNRRTLDAARRAWRVLRSGAPTDRVRTAARGIADIVRVVARPAPMTPLNPHHIGPHRRFETVDLDLVAVKRIKTMLGGTVNDVVVAICTGALRRFLARRGVGVDHLRDLRALIPVNARPAGDTAVGNKVAMLLAHLPVSEADPVRRLARVRDDLDRLKDGSGQAEGSLLGIDVADTIATSLLSTIMKMAIKVRSFNVTITNVPGPQMPLYLLGSKLVAMYPKVPLYEAQGVGFAVFSYDGKLHFGLSGCWHTVPDLHHLALDLRASFDELMTAANAATPRVQVVRPAI